MNEYKVIYTISTHYGDSEEKVSVFATNKGEAINKGICGGIPKINRVFRHKITGVKVFPIRYFKRIRNNLLDAIDEGYSEEYISELFKKGYTEISAEEYKSKMGKDLRIIYNYE